MKNMIFSPPSAWGGSDFLGDLDTSLKRKDSVT